MDKNLIEQNLNEILVVAEKESKYKEEIRKEKLKIEHRLIEGNLEEYLTTLPYKKAKEVAESVGSVVGLEYYNKLKNETLRDIKLKDFPQVDYAYRYPILNSLTNLSKKQIKDLDTFLTFIYNHNSTLTIDGIEYLLCLDLKKKREEVNNIFKVLLNEKVIQFDSEKNGALKVILEPNKEI